MNAVKSKSKQFFSNTSFNLAGQAVRLAFGIATSAILARALGTEARGDLALILLLPLTLLAVFAKGFTSTITYSVASGIWKDEDIMPSISGIAFYLSGIMIFCACAVLLFHEKLFPGISIYLLLATIFYIPLELWTLSLQSVLTGKQAFREKMNLAILTNPIRFLIIASLVWTFPKRVDIGLLAIICVVIVNSIFVYKKCLKVCNQSNLFAAPQFDLRAMRESLAYGGISQLGGVARFLNFKADQFLVFWFLGSAPLGIYVVGVRLAEMLWIFVGNISTVLFSLTAENKKAKNSHTVASRVAAIVFWFNIGVGAVLAIVAIPSVRLIYGMEYAQAGTIVLYLLPGITTLGFAKVTANYLAGIGRPGINAVGSVAGVFINIVANVILIPKFGLVGAAIATSISYTSIGIYSYFCFLYITGLHWYEPLIPKYRDLATIYSYSTRLIARN